MCRMVPGARAACVKKGLVVVASGVFLSIWGMWLFFVQ